MLAKYLQIEGFVISTKSVLDPVQKSEWLGKTIHLLDLGIGNSQMLHTRLFAALLQMHGKVGPVKLIQRVLGFIGHWLLRGARERSLAFCCWNLFFIGIWKS